MTTREFRLVVLTSVLSAWMTSGVHGEGSAKPLAGPATVENRVKEADLTKIALTPDAERRLGIELVAAESKPIARSRRLPGEAFIPPGRSIAGIGPRCRAGGLLRHRRRRRRPPGSESSEVGVLFRLLPGESPDGRTFVPADRISLTRATADLAAARVEAEGQLKEAEVRVEAAEIKLKRADQLRQEGAGAQRAFDEAPGRT